MTLGESGFTPLFDGVTLAGWRSVPRVYTTLYPGGPDISSFFARQGLRPPVEPEKHPAVWTVEDGAVVGRQGTPGYGGYLLSEKAYGEFELVIEAKPDWPADTGIMLRRRPDSWHGFQVLVDHRRSGSIGGFFGNGLASFHAVPFALDSVLDDAGNPVGLRPDDPVTSQEPVTPEKQRLLSYVAGVEEFLKAWRWGDWNEVRVLCVGGALPTLTTWVNGLKIAELDTAAIDVPDYDAAAIAGFLGPAGHLALEVHDNDDMFGESRWGAGAACRWRNARIKEL
ncbi:DUF1080 domain-containing protein [Kineosporia sp. NBRC 101731]|uniref:3-keto-disaccharide hydrolase n=1 Tax=Kineosporia sp. NBRC 101731 TaxID=3032199 RepID=UPI0024A15029|nr:DUF1080 domain-containing protein [Kineosporia sp. NBRC 101731]GLY31066.1 hypothetical protein Kisp02_44310 [Kineosporia sp. NBRC 101731]